MSKKINFILLLSFFVCLLYLVMFLDTNAIIHNVKNIMLGNVDGTVTADTPLDRYNIISRHPKVKVEANIRRLFVAHNFFDGYMWVIYSYEYQQSDYKAGTWNVISKWKIHKVDGKWQVVDIEEKM